LADGDPAAGQKMGIDGFDRQMARSSRASRWIGGASLEEEGVAGVADSDRFGRGGQRELVVGAAVTEDLPTVPTVVLERETREKNVDIVVCADGRTLSAEGTESLIHLLSVE